jgi:uncharacterized protein YndB with AHSA1/START domain
MSASPQYDVEITHVFDASPERVYRAFTDAAEFARWYGPPGFPVDPETVELDGQVGSRHQFAMVAEHDPSMRTVFDGRLVEVVENKLLASRGAWDGIPDSRRLGHRTYASNSTRRMARPDLSCARGLTHPE